jgi:4-carboxymuconolactone decarboxylase
VKQNSELHDMNVSEMGQEMYREVFGKPFFDTDQPAPLVGVREFTINHLFANVWSRSRNELDGSNTGITLRERRLITIALLAAQGRADQLRDHVNGARRAGISKEVLLETMIHVAHYAGWPAGASGQSVVKDQYRDQNA